MGTMFSSLFGYKQATVVLLGRGYAGKTAILNRLQGRDTVVSTATVGYNIEIVLYNDIEFQLMELGGQSKISYTYFPNPQAIIYVVDSTDTDMLVVAKDELQEIYKKAELNGVAILIFANKQDLPGALDAAAVTEALELHKINSRQWAIFEISAAKGEGIFEGLDWIIDAMKAA